jgi:chromosome segregation ATPase
MGLIRKTLSISTLGLVSWRSKKEELAEARAELDLTRADLEQATEKHARLRDRVIAAEKRAEEAELHALRDARKAGRRGRRGERREMEMKSRLGRRQVAVATLRGKVNPLVDTTRETTHRIAKDIEPQVEEARKRGRKARADAEKRARELRERTKRAAESVLEH